MKSEGRKASRKLQAETALTLFMSATQCAFVSILRQGEAKCQVSATGTKCPQQSMRRAKLANKGTALRPAPFNDET
eukprot:2665648-Rhodomonas_salina.2